MIQQVAVYPQNWVARDILAVFLCCYEDTDDPRVVVSVRTLKNLRYCFDHFLQEYPEVCHPERLSTLMQTSLYTVP